MRRTNWARTPLGPMDRWPPALRTAVDICLHSRLPMFVWWGPDLINIYNDAYAPVLGKRHPDALGRPAREIWADIWPAIADDVDRVVRDGQPIVRERVRFVMERNGYPEETYFTYSHSPIPDGRGGIGGLFQVCTDETARVLAERERDRLADQSRTILESITDAFFAVDRDWRFTYANPQAERVLGRAPGDLLGKVIWDEYPGLRGSDFERVYRQAAAERAAGSVTAFYPDHDRWYEVHAYPAPGGGGIAVYFRNVTERRRDEAALRELADRFERQSRLFDQVASTTPDFIYTFDLDGRFLYANRRLLEVWGRTFDEAVGKSLYELGYPQWHADMHMREIRQVIETKQPIKGEVPFTGGSGIFGVYEYIFTPVLGADGNVEVIAGTTRDVTDRMRAEKALAEAKAAAETALAALQESERRLRAVVEATPECVKIVSPDGLLTYMNPAGIGMIEADALASVQGVCVYELIAPEHRTEWIERHRRICAGEKLTWEFEIVGMHGTRRWMETHAVPLAMPDGRTGQLAVTREITARKRAEAERESLLESERAARVDAERASRMKDEFLSTLSHELRTPLNAIVGWSQLLRGGRAAPADLAEGIATIERNARAQTEIIEDLLDMSRITAGKVRLDVQPVDLAAVVKAALDTARPAAEAKGVRLHADLDYGVAPVSGDPNRLQQVLWNLLANAVKFTPADGQVRVLLRRADDDDAHVELRVTDTGEGIRPDFLPHVFDRFRQADATTTRRHGGLGLGLSIVKQLVEMHGGRVRAESAGPGSGATFIVSLPLAASHPAPPASAPDDVDRWRPRVSSAAPVGASSDVQARLKGVDVLVVDDEPDVRSLVRRLLEDCDARVRVTASAAEAFDALRSSPPDVLVSDIGMPGEDGYSLIRRVRDLLPQRGGDVPALALTAYARTEDRVRALHAGFQLHLVKPVEPAELVTMVANLAARTRQE